MLADTLTPGTVMWFWAAAATIIATLASVVSVLYKAQMSMKDAEIKSAECRESALKSELAQSRTAHENALQKLNKEVDECRKDREDLRVEMARFETRLAMLERHDVRTADAATKLKGRLDNLERDS
jgi:peptidoglycan hydrolase CwlO-like protein